ncbi:MAG: NfeD family protein [Ectothiorhodospiraceae bacterium AqS1]|nr:NfeD family protein [Ectothiorhodospiraceae bacterium AqS1]
MEWTAQQISLAWFLLGALLLFSEFLLPGFIVIFFGVAAWLVALAVWAFDISFNTQILIFIVASIVSILTLRRYFKRTFKGETVGMDSQDRRIGQHAEVVEAIPVNGAGRIRGLGSTWPAVADQPIAVGTPVVVVSVDESSATIIKVREI